MNLKKQRWDVSENLETPEKIAAYLEAALEDGDPQLIAVVLNDIAKAVNQAASSLE
jgi:probable addiction module antidote protein